MKKDQIGLITILASSGLALVGYTYLTPPVRTKAFIEDITLFQSFPLDVPMYVERFLLAFLLLGVLPAITALVFHVGPKSAGLTTKLFPVKPVHLILLLGAGVAIGAIGSVFGELDSQYPYLRSLSSLVRSRGWIFFIAHAFAYLLLYYLPWEFLFRGVLVLGLLEKTEVDRWPLSAAAVAIASFQSLPSTLLHFGHPFTETLMALPLGLALGIVVLRCGSIVPGFVFHAATGISLDLFIVLREVAR